VIRHPLVRIGHQGATAESNLRDMEVIRRLRGDEKKAAINAMIEANMPLVFLKVESYIGLHSSVGFLKDDLVSVGLIALTQAVYKLADQATPPGGGNPSGFINQRIIWEMCRLIDQDARQNIPEGYTPVGPSVVDPMEIVDARDMLEAICYTEEEVVILQMKEDGSTDDEIAQRLDVTKRTVREHRRILEKRYQTLVSKLDR